MNRYSKMGIVLLAGTWLLVGCGGGGGPTAANQSDTTPPPSGEGNTDSGNGHLIPPTNPPGEGTGTGGNTGGTGGTGTGGNTGGGSTGGPLTGIDWDDPNDNPDRGVIPYAFKPSYTIPENDPEDDPATPDVDETMKRQVYIQEIQRDADYADQTALDIVRQIDDLRTGADTGGTPGPTLFAWQGSTHTIIRAARGVSMGLDAAATEDIAAERAQAISGDFVLDRSD